MSYDNKPTKALWTQTSQTSDKDRSFNETIQSLPWAWHSFAPAYFYTFCNNNFFWLNFILTNIRLTKIFPAKFVLIQLFWGATFFYNFFSPEFCLNKVFSGLKSNQNTFFLPTKVKTKEQFRPKSCWYL